MTTDIIKLCLLLVSIALSIAALLLACLAARYARRTEAAYDRVREARARAEAANARVQAAYDRRREGR